MGVSYGGVKSLQPLVETYFKRNGNGDKIFDNYQE